MQSPRNLGNTPYNNSASIVIDLRWTIDALIHDAILDPSDANLITSSPRPKDQAHWHPLQIIAHHQVPDQRHPEKSLNIQQLTEWLAKKAHLPIYNIDPLKIDVTAVTSIMSYKFAELHHILAVQVTQDEVQFVTSQPFYREWESGLSQVIRGKIFTTFIANPEDIYKYRIEMYNLAKSVSGATDKSDYATSAINNFEHLLELKDLKNADANDQHIANIVDWLLQYAFDQRASDIHLEPRREIGYVRFRIDGVLHTVYEMPANVIAAVTSRIKIIGRMNVAEKRRPQDGRLKTKMPNATEIELRLSTLPTAFGEKLVLRIFDPEVLVRTYQQLGFSKDEYNVWKSMVSNPNGIVLVTGPTGSGKTTTLYSTLKQIASTEVNVCTLEDPIEMVEPSFNQVQIQHNIDLNFAEGIRALMRQDPDIIMVGEIRDIETAEMAIQAALTGHLVISTLHTNNASAAITRLLDLGVPSYLIGSTVIGVMAQRLLRTLCPHCKEAGTISDDHWQMITAPWKSQKPEKVYYPKGCLECRDTGYLGRIGIYEILYFSQNIKDLISNETNLEQLSKQAYKEGMRSLRLSGAKKIAAGETTLAEVLRVTPASNR